MGNICAPVDDAKETRNTMEPDIIRLDSPKTIIRRVEIESIVNQRELEMLCWGTKEVLRWMDIMGWSRYKAMFLEKNVDGESLADLRPLTLVRDLSVAPLDAFPLFNDISPLFRNGDFSVKDYDLEFRRKVDLSWMDTQLDQRINREIAVGILEAFRGQYVELNDPALEYLVGVLTSDFLRFLRKPPLEREQAIIRGVDPINLPLPQKVIIYRDEQTNEEKENVCIETRDKPAEKKVNEDLRLPLGKTPSRTPKGHNSTIKWTIEKKEPLSLGEESDKPKPSDQTIGYLHEECPICLTPFDEGNDLMALPCAHLFCQRCITDWLSLERSCPICQMNPDDEDLTMALLDSAFMACSLPNYESTEKGLRSESLMSSGKSFTDRDEQKSPMDSSLSRIRRASYQGPTSSYSRCALCEGPVNVSKRHVRYNCGHVFHNRCSRATGLRGGCPFCSGAQVRAQERIQNPVPQANSSQTLSSERWQFRREGRWQDLPANVVRSIDRQMRQSQPTSEVLVFDEKRYELRARERRLVDISHLPPRSYRIRKLRGQGNRRNERSCLVM